MKTFLITVCETYDGYEWHEKCLVTADNKEELYAMPEADLAYYGHEDIGSDICIENVQELTKQEFDLLSKFL
jgi:hypothetical protein